MCFKQGHIILDFVFISDFKNLGNFYYRHFLRCLWLCRSEQVPSPLQTSVSTSVKLRYLMEPYETIRSLVKGTGLSGEIAES